MGPTQRVGARKPELLIRQVGDMHLLNTDSWLVSFFHTCKVNGALQWGPMCSYSAQRLGCSTDFLGHSYPKSSIVKT